MTDTMPDHPVMPSSPPPPWGRYTAVMAALGASSVYIIGRWGEIEPVLESPAIIVISMLGVFGLGGLSAYWLLARPHEERLKRAELVINRLRDQERSLLERMGSKDVQIGVLQNELEHLKESVADLRAELVAMRAAPAPAPAPLPKRPRAPKA